MINVLFVCMGNICRSPTAEGLFSTQVSRLGLSDSFLVDSAGTHARNGSPPDARSTKIALENGVDISNLRSRPLCTDDFYIYDHIICMDQDNFGYAYAMSPSQSSSKISLILDYLPEQPQRSIPDPYIHTNGFQLVFDLINQSSAELIKTLSPDDPPK